LHPPGSGIVILSKKCNIGDKSNILALISLILITSKLSILKFDESKNKVSSIKSCVTHKDHIISSIVTTSHIRGTFLKNTFHLISTEAASNGKQAFFDQLIFILHDNFFHQFTINIGQIINN
jgi:hypothetical protein